MDMILVTELLLSYRHQRSATNICNSNINDDNYRYNHDNDNALAILMVLLQIPATYGLLLTFILTN